MSGAGSSRASHKNWAPRRTVVPTNQTASVGRQAGVHVTGPAQHATTTCTASAKPALCSAARASAERAPDFAVQHDRLVLRQTRPARRPTESGPWESDRTRNPDDLVLMRLTDVDQREAVAPVELLLELTRRDRVPARPCWRRRKPRRRGVVVDQLGDLRLSGSLRILIVR